MKRFLTTLFVFLTLAPLSFAETISNYLILQDIGPFKLDRPEKKFPGIAPTGGPEIHNNSPGIVGPVDHLTLDHNDTTYKVMYLGGNGIPSPTIFVTQHSGADSDKWLLHELDVEFRNYYGFPEYYLKNINGNAVYVYGAGGRDYRWLSGSKVITIEYHDSQLTKPEPIEVIQAYLAKHPSTLPALTMKELNSIAHKTAWIKDEMDRRLWLCDKWFMQLQLRKVEEKQVYQESVKSMNIFLDYREKYYRTKAADDKNLLASYLSASNGTGIKAKLKEYKDWWAVNKDKAITL